jgi:hypothetical protein
VSDKRNDIQRTFSNHDSRAALLAMVAAAPSADFIPVPRGWLVELLEETTNRSEAVALSLGEAAAETGYSADHLGRLVRQGRIPNAGRKNAPRVLRSDLPRKPAGLTARRTDLHLVGADPRQVARALVTASTEAA